METTGWKGVRVWLLVRFPIRLEMLLILSVWLAAVTS
jgi:hypothetical protein